MNDEMNDEMKARLTAFLADRLPGAGEVRIEGLDQQRFGYSAELLLFTVVSTSEAGEQRLDVVARLRPPAPGLLEPYDMAQLYAVMGALHDTSVKAPRVLMVEPTGEVLGRAFLVMERVGGTAYEMVFPEEHGLVPGRVRRMCESLVEELAAVHHVDVRATGLVDLLGDGTGFFDAELERWHAEAQRVQRGPLPAMERLHDELRRTQPRPSERVALLHGDAKPGNYGYVEGEVTAVFDWELAGVGDPLVDLGYLEVLWTPPIAVGLSAQPDAFTADELVEHYQQVSGVPVHDREWYRAFAAYKIAVISLMVAMRIEHGHSQTAGLGATGLGIPLLVDLGLTSLGITEPIDQGPYTISEQRQAELGIDLTQFFRPAAN